MQEENEDKSTFISISLNWSYRKEGDRHIVSIGFNEHGELGGKSAQFDSQYDTFEEAKSRLVKLASDLHFDGYVDIEGSLVG